MAGAVLTCAVDLVNGACPEGSAIWVEHAVLTPDTLWPLVTGFMGLFLVAYLARMVIRTMRVV